MKRYSKQRETILDMLKNRKDHPTADMLYIDLKKELPDIGIATVYRNLADLSDQGKILKIRNKTGGSDRFDGNIEPHIHFECNNCKNIYDIFPDKEQTINLNDNIKKMVKLIKADLTYSEIHINGYCEECKTAK